VVEYEGVNEEGRREDVGDGGGRKEGLGGGRIGKGLNRAEEKVGMKRKGSNGDWKTEGRRGRRGKARVEVGGSGTAKGGKGGG